MKRVVYGERQRLLEFAEGILPATRFTDLAHPLGVEVDGLLRGVIVFDRFTPSDCELSAASDGRGGWLDRSVMVQIAAYPFGQLNLARVTAFVEVGNEQARQICRRLGFVHEGTKRHPDFGRQVQMLGLIRSECAWAPALPLRRAA